METFTPGSALLGGALIGIAATLLLVATGRVAGVSGIVASLLQPGEDHRWRIAFLLGMFAAPVLFAVVGGRIPTIEIEASAPVLVVAGLLVGLGTRMGGGCTSGHGVCGVARGSARSIVATLVFVVAAIATVAVSNLITG